MSLINLIPFAVAIWLGLFLITRGAHPRLRLTALGLFFYAAALAADESLSQALRLLPPVLWVGAIVHLDLRVADKHPTLLALWKWLLLPVTILLGGFFLLDPSASQCVLSKWIVLLLGLTPLFWTLFLMHDFIALLPSKQATGILFTATLFFALGEGFVLLPLNANVQRYVLPAIGFDLLILGFCMAWFDAFDEGETFLPEMIRSFALTSIITMIFAGQVGFVIVIQTGLTEGMQLLLTTTVIASIVIAVFGNSLQNKLDVIAFSRAPSVREARNRLQAESDILSRKDAGLNLKEMSEEERSRFTRRALSHFGDLTRLASNPLTQLPVIEQHLRMKNIPDTTLARAAELKAVLTELIAKLKPQSEKLFDTTDEWRFYNSVHFPYVAGLRPYSRSDKPIAPHEQEANEWFRTFVPERTLHNWQNAAAKLIAQELWESNYVIASER
jgi:hypothetical protein